MTEQISIKKHTQKKGKEQQEPWLAIPGKCSWSCAPAAEPSVNSTQVNHTPPPLWLASRTNSKPSKPRPGRQTALRATWEPGRKHPWQLLMVENYFAIRGPLLARTLSLPGVKMRPGVAVLDMHAGSVLPPSINVCLCLCGNGCDNLLVIL